VNRSRGPATPSGEPRRLRRRWRAKRTNRVRCRDSRRRSRDGRDSAGQPFAEELTRPPGSDARRMDETVTDSRLSAGDDLPDLPAWALRDEASIAAPRMDRSCGRLKNVTSSCRPRLAAMSHTWPRSRDLGSTSSGEGCQSSRAGTCRTIFRPRSAMTSNSSRTRHGIESDHQNIALRRGQ
jgi:hypothetical protein